MQSNDLALSVRGLSKAFTIVHDEEKHVTLAEKLFARLRNPFARQKTESFRALKDINLDIKKGQVVGIIGRNGAGKSTLLKILSRITEPSLGEIRLYGRVGSLLEVGTGFHGELTGRENVFLNGAILGMSKGEIRKQFNAIVDFAEVGQFIDTPVKRYSSGMYVRLAFAVAAQLDPEILVLDEVLAVGDAEFQNRCFARISEIRKSGKTVLIVSHSMASIKNLCNRAILLNAGSVEADGMPEEVTQTYLSGNVAARGEVVWSDPMSAPGNDIVRLHKVRVSQSGADGPFAEVDISKEVQVELTYWNLVPGQLLYAAIWIHDAGDTCLLSSSCQHRVSLTDDAWNGKPHPIGLFRSICRIPPNFFNEGTYKITAILGRGICEALVQHRDAVSFQVYDTGEMRSGGYYGGWIGIVRPKLAWSTDHLSEWSI